MSEIELGGGSLRHILERYVVEDGTWRKHAARLGKPGGAKVCKALAGALGGDVPAEIEEWVDAEGKGLRHQNDTGWMVGLELDAPDSAQKAITRHPELLLAGLVAFGHGASGDRLFVSLLPHPLGVAPVYRWDHEIGKLDERIGESIADFLVATWVDEEHDDFRSIAKARKAFATRVKNASDAGLPSDELLERSQWILGLLHGEPAFEFPALLAKAPGLDVWKREKAKLGTHPQLAVYWMLAHVFLGNDAAAEEAATAAGKSAGAWVKELARSVQAFLAGKAKSPLESLSAKKLEAMREVVAKNAATEQTGRKSAVDDSEVRAHDVALEALAKSDPAKAKQIEEYFRERDDDSPANSYPYKALLPGWLVAPAAAAYRAGLRVDLGHPKAYVGITLALAGRADHPDARAVLITALGTLAPGDRRLEYIVPALVERTEPDVITAVRDAAYRWVELAPKIDAQLAKREQSFTLDDVFANDDMLQPAVVAALERCDEEAEKLALAISEKNLSFRVRKTIAGMQCRVYGARGVSARLEPMMSLLEMFAQAESDESEAVRLDATTVVALSEASLAVARLDPKAARPVFAKVLGTKRFSTARTAGVNACVLPGILALDREDASGRKWLERVLGARNGDEHVYGALIAAREARLTEAIPWLVPHAYASRLNTMMGQYAFVEATARKTLAALGKPPPAFDEDDEYAREVPVGKLGEALVRHDRYDNGAVLERMTEAKTPKVFVAPVAAFLEERFRFSRHETETHITSDDLGKAIELLRAAGAPGKAELDRLAKLPEIGAWAKDMIKG